MATKSTRARGTGTLDSYRTKDGKLHYRGRLQLADGTRSPWLPVPDRFSYSEERAGEWVAAMQEAERENPKFLTAKRARLGLSASSPASELWAKWFGRYLVIHERLGHKVTQHRTDFAAYVPASLREKPIASLTPSDVKAIRDELTAARLAGKIGAKRALNLWSDIVKAPLSRAFTDDDPKYDDVRVGPASTNPALGIKPPASVSDKEEDERERQALEPAEGLSLLSCVEVPLEDRRFYAVAMYTGLRPAELYGLTWADVRIDVARPIVKVVRGRDMKTGEDEDTKTRDSVRDVPIHPHLVPLLRVMGEGNASSR